MPVSANTTRPIAFARRLSGNMEPPMYTFPLAASQTIRSGDPLVFSGGRATEGGTPVLVATLIGFAAAPDSGAPPFPTSAGVMSGQVPTLVTTTGSVSALLGDNVPDSQKINVVLALPDVLFYGNIVTINGGEADRAATLTDIGAPAEINEYTPTGETARWGLDQNASTNDVAIPMAFAYPQLPVARSTSALADPYMVTTSVNNARVEFLCRNTIWII